MHSNAFLIDPGSPNERDLAMITQFLEVMTRYRSRIGMVIAALDTPEKKRKNGLNATFSEHAPVIDAADLVQDVDSLVDAA